MYYIKANDHVIERDSFRAILSLARYCSNPQRLTLDTYCIYAGKTPDYENKNLDRAEEEANRFGLDLMCYKSDEEAKKACEKE